MHRGMHTGPHGNYGKWECVSSKDERCFAKNKSSWLRESLQTLFYLFSKWPLKLLHDLSMDDKPRKKWKLSSPWEIKISQKCSICCSHLLPWSSLKESSSRVRVALSGILASISSSADRRMIKAHTCPLSFSYLEAGSDSTCCCHLCCNVLKMSELNLLPVMLIRHFKPSTFSFFLPEISAVCEGEKL
jgi:hypothetical protein